MATTWYRQGKVEGLNEGEQNMVLHLLSKRFDLTPSVQNQIKHMESEQLKQLAEGLFDPTKNLKDLGLAN